MDGYSDRDSYDSPSNLADDDSFSGPGSFIGQSRLAEASFRGSDVITPGMPRIVVVGLPGTGKTSIQNVVFQKFPAQETLFVESTTRILKQDIENSAFVRFEVWDMPGRFDMATEMSFDAVLAGCSELVYVIDVTSEETDASMQHLHQTVTQAFLANPRLSVEVFVHKADALTDPQRVRCVRELHERVEEELCEINLSSCMDSMKFRPTSIFDHSIHYAMSQAIQRLIPELAVLRNLLTVLANSCSAEKVFLFDMVSKLSVADDTGPTHVSGFELCSDAMEVMVDFSLIYQTHAQAGSARDMREFDVRRLGGSITNATSITRLSNGQVLYLSEVAKYLAVCCIIREQIFDNQAGIIEYNVDVLRSTLDELIQNRVT